MSKIPKEWLNLNVAKDNCLTSSDIIYNNKIGDKWQSIRQFIDSKFPRFYNYTIQISSLLNHSVEFLKFNLNSNSLTCFLSFYVNVNNISISKVYLISIDTSLVKNKWVKISPISDVVNESTDDFDLDVKLSESLSGVFRIRRSNSKNLVEFQSNVSIHLNLINAINVPLFKLNNSVFVNSLPEDIILAYKSSNLEFKISSSDLTSFYRSIFHPNALVFHDVNHAINYLYDIGSNVNYLEDIIFRHNKITSIFQIKDLFPESEIESTKNVHGIDDTSQCIQPKDIEIHRLKTKNIHGFDGTHGFNDILVFLDLIILLLKKCGIEFVLSSIKSIEVIDIAYSGGTIGSGLLAVEAALEAHTHDGSAHPLVTISTHGFESIEDKLFLDNLIIFESDTVHYLNPQYRIASKIVKVTKKADLTDSSKIGDVNLGDICIVNDAESKLFESYCLVALPATDISSWVVLSVEFPVKSIAGYSEGDITLTCNSTKKDVIDIKESGIRDVGDLGSQVSAGNHVHGFNDIIPTSVIASLSDVCPDGYSPITTSNNAKFSVDGTKVTGGRTIPNPPVENVALNKYIVYSDLAFGDSAFNLNFSVSAHGLTNGNFYTGVDCGGGSSSEIIVNCYGIIVDLGKEYIIQKVIIGMDESSDVGLYFINGTGILTKESPYLAVGAPWGNFQQVVTRNIDLIPCRFLYVSRAHSGPQWYSISEIQAFATPYDYSGQVEVFLYKKN